MTIDRAAQDYGLFFPERPEGLSVTTETAPTGTVWIWIERETHADAYVGPYADEVAAVRALDEAALVDALCSEDALDASLVRLDGVDAGGDVHVIDPTNHHHTGDEPTAHERVWSGKHKAYVCTVCWVAVRDTPADVVAEYEGDLPAAWEDCSERR